MTSLNLPINLDLDPVIALKQLCEEYPEQMVITTSLGLEDQALIDLIARNNIPVKLLTLDAGRLFPATYSLLDRTKSKYDIHIKSVFHVKLSLEEYLNEQGMNSSYSSVDCRKTCCKIRKIDPLFRAVKDAKFWFTGLRADQSENRSSIPRVERDAMTGLIKFNPILDWNEHQLQSYIKSHSVPINTLHRKGYPSIGCAPFTRAIQPEEHPRSGRW